MEDYQFSMSYTEKPKTFDEKMREGASLDDGLGGSMKIDKAVCYPYTKRTHKPIGCEDGESGY